MPTYTLPSSVGLAGVWSFQVTSDQAGLTVPAFDTILEVGDLVESVDEDVGVSELSRLTITVRDDTSTHAEGFWYNILSGVWSLKVLLDEGAGNTFYFYGYPQEETVVWDEKYIGSVYIRTARLTLVSAAIQVFDTLTSTWVDEVLLRTSGNTVKTPPTYLFQAASLKELFACMLSASGLNSSYSSADVSFVFDASNPDFKFYDGASEYHVDKVYVPISYHPGGFAGQTYMDYWDSTSGRYFGNDFKYLKDIVSLILRNFGLTMRFSYDLSSGRHLIQLIQRGRAYSGTIDFGSTVMESNISKAHFLLGDSVRFQGWDLGSSTGWMSKSVGSATFSTASPPNWLDFDIDTVALWVLDTDTLAGTAQDFICVGNTVYTCDQADKVEYYNYATSAYVEASETDIRNEMLEALCGYYLGRYTTEYSSIERRYGKLGADAGAGDAHTNVNIMRRTSINDGLGAANYYANKVTKQANTATTLVEWIKE